MNLDHARPSIALTAVTQLLLGALFLFGIAAIVFLPSFSARIVASDPEYAELRGPLLATTIAFAALGVIAVAMVALLVQRIYTGTILARSSLLWVDVVISTLVCGVVLIVTAGVLISSYQAGSPFIALILLTGCFMLVALCSVTLMLRSLLRHAILMRSELDEIV